MFGLAPTSPRHSTTPGDIVMEVASTSDRAKSFGRFLESLGTGLLGNRLAGDRFRQRVCWGTG